MTEQNLKSVTEGVERELEALAQLPHEDQKQKNADVKDMIRYYTERTDAIEERRNSIYDFTLQYIAVLLTLLGIGIVLYTEKVIQYKVLLLLVLPALGVQFFSSLLVILTFELQSQYKYPFLDLKDYGNKWKWFYRANEHIMEMHRNVFTRAESPRETETPFLQGLRAFVDNYAKETPEQELQDNVQQLYLLQVHNFYKNQFYLHLMKIRLVGLIVTAVVFVVSLIAVVVA